jgi:flagellar protein FlaG
VTAAFTKMSSSFSVSSAGSPGDSTYGGGAHPQPEGSGAGAGPATSDQAHSDAPDPADLRLVIEDDLVAGSFVYKTVDRRTGKVVQQLPREQILALREASDYTAGAVIKAKV